MIIEVGIGSGFVLQSLEKNLASFYKGLYIGIDINFESC